MEEFLRNYVKMLAEVRETKLTKNQFNKLIQYLMNADDMWDEFDNYITNCMDNIDDLDEE